MIRSTPLYRPVTARPDRPALRRTFAFPTPALRVALALLAALAFATSGAARAIELDITPVDSFDVDDPSLPADGRRIVVFRNHDLPCFQPDFPDDPLATRGNHEFAVAFPVGFDFEQPAPAPFYLAIRGGGFGWVEAGVPPASPDQRGWLWDPEADVWLEGDYRGDRQHATADAPGLCDPLDPDSSCDVHPGGNRPVFFQYLFDTDGLLAEVLAERPGWAVAVASYCSHDIYLGRLDGGVFNNPSGRVGYTALRHALLYLDGTFGIDHFYAVGNSSGAAGAFFLARDLAEDPEPELAGLELRGVILDSFALEAREYAALFDEHEVRTVEGVDANGDDIDVEVPCESDAEPFAQGFAQAGLSLDAGEEVSMADDLLAGRVDVPVLHVWNTRDESICYDRVYSEDSLHGPIGSALATAPPPGDMPALQGCSRPIEVCHGATDFGEAQVLCTDHVLLGARVTQAGVEDAMRPARNFFRSIERYHATGEPCEEPMDGE